VTVAVIIARLQALGAAVAARGTTRTRDRLIATAATELPGIAAVDHPAGIALTAANLRAQAFGTRRHARDPRLVAFSRARS